MEIGGGVIALDGLAVDFGDAVTGIGGERNNSCGPCGCVFDEVSAC